ncbi:MAG: MCE family protein [Calothrix sp. SM1_5_4]|nr:MCE family protein [Calothrix sp. SM1_5_4]
MTSWLGTPEFKVGFLVVAVAALIAVMALKVAEGPGVLGGQKKYHIRADSAGGLVQNSAVKMAGIKIGIIDEIILEDGRAKIVVALDGGTVLTSSTGVELKSDGILGDKHVELYPGNPADPVLPPGSELHVRKGQGGMDDVMQNISKAAKSAYELMEALKRSSSEGDRESTLGRILLNIEQVSADLKEVTADNKEAIGELVARLRNITKNVDTYINEESLARVDRSLRNIEDITAKISKGEGTLGRLVNDEQTIEQINSAVENVNKFLGGAQQMETSVDFHSEFLSGDHNKSYLGVRIQPGLDRYYEIQAISDSNGVVRSTSTRSTSDGVPHTYEETTTYKNKFKVTGVFAKNFWDFTIKGGLIENYGGVGFDYYFLNRSLRFSAEFFNFSELQIRAFVRYNFFKGVYVIGGGDNLLSKDGGRASGFVGAGLFITNDDLKTLAGKVSF